MLAQRLAKHRGIKLSTLGMKLHGNATFFEEIGRQGMRSFRVDTYDDLMSKFSVEYEKDGLDWPTTIPRPTA